jgi:hypothetical protein
MNVAEMMDYLSKFDPKQEVMIRDGFNGGGNLRVINSKCESTLGIDDEDLYDEEGEMLESKGLKVVELGFGFY